MTNAKKQGVFRLGLIGCGAHALDYLCPPLSKLPDAELVACCDVDEGRTAQAMRSFGFQRPYLDYNTMLAKEDLHGVVIALPHSRLAGAAVAALRAGRNVFIEKPMAASPAEAREMRDAAKKSGASLMVGYCERFAEGRRIMKRLIEQGAIGDIVAVNAAKGSPPLLTGWQSDPTMGGGPIRWVGSHVTDQVLWMVGSEPERVSADITWRPNGGVEQDVSYTIRFKNGVLASFLCSQQVGAVDFVEVFGTKGRVRAEWPAEYYTIPGDTVTIQSAVVPAYANPTTILPGAPHPANMYAAELKEWLASLKERRQPAVTIEDGIAVVTVLDAVCRSARSGKPVAL